MHSECRHEAYSDGFNRHTTDVNTASLLCTICRSLQGGCCVMPVEECRAVACPISNPLHVKSDLANGKGYVRILWMHSLQTTA